jgi:hypothetical protein
MSILALQRVLAPPLKPHCAVRDEAAWQALEQKHQIVFPSDFKQFIGVYGTGTIVDFITIFNPFSITEDANFFHNMEFVLPNERRFQQIPLPLYPEAHGLLPFATTYDGDNLWWQTTGMPDEWHTVITRVKSDEYELYPMTVTEFFTQIIVHDPDPKKDIVTNSDILYGLDRTAPFKSYQVEQKRLVRQFKSALLSQKYIGMREMSKDALAVSLRRYGLELDSELIAEQLEAWQREELIDLPKKDDIYLRIVG